MRADITVEDFAVHLRSAFRIPRGAGPPLELELIEVERLTQPRSGTTRSPFTVIFRGPSSPALAQGIYRLEHEGCEPCEIFLVPIGPEGDSLGPHYQAIFQ